MTSIYRLASQPTTMALCKSEGLGVHTTMKKLKLILSAVLFVFGVLVVCAFVMNNLAPSPVAAAKAHSVQQGWTDNELSLLGFETSAKIAGSQGTVRLKRQQAEPTGDNSR